MPANIQNPNPYNRYGSPYAPSESDPYAVPSNYAYPLSNKPSFDKPEDMGYGHSTPYTPQQYSSQVVDPQTYTNPYYSATQNNSTVVTDTQYPNPYSGNVPANATPSTSQYNPYSDPYGQPQMPPVPESTPSMSSYQNDMNVNFAQMQISFPKSEPAPVSAGYGADYSQTFYSVQYPQAATPNMSTYSHAPQNANTSVTPSQLPSDYSALNYPYTTDQQFMQPQQTNPTVSTPYSNTEYSYSTSGYANMSQAYPIYTNTDSTVTSTTSVANPVTSSQSYAYPPAQDPSFANPNPALSQLDVFDKPIKSHVTGEALVSNLNFQPSYQGYDQNAIPNYTNPTEINYQVPPQNPLPIYSNPPDQNYPTNNPTLAPAYSNQNKLPETPVADYSDSASQNYQANIQVSAPSYSNPAEQNYQASNGYTYPNDANVSYAQTFQNHPGYTFNSATGNYDYAYGSQNSYIDLEQQSKDQNWPAQYTNAGTCDTVQSPSENQPGMQGSEPPSNNQTYYNAPYGYQTMQPNDAPPMPEFTTTNYGANVNQATYMQSGQGHNANVTYTSNQGKIS